MLALASPAYADCPATPIGNANDMVVSFMATHGTQNAPAALLPSSVKEGMLVYDSSADTLKLCDGTIWHPISMGTASDPRIGTLDAGKWCSSDGTIINCTTDAPATVVGSNRQVIFNDGGTALAGAAQMVWHKTTNRLGVGTVVPESTLHVFGKAIFDSNGFNHFDIRNLDGLGDPVLGLFVGADFWRLHHDADENNSLQWRWNNARRWTMTTDGNVGIGSIPAPAARLHVAGGVKMGNDTDDCPGTGNVKLGTLRYGTGNVFSACLSTGWTPLMTGTGALAAGSTGQIQFNGGGGTFAADPALFWHNSGKRLGIGTSSPERAVHIVGDGGGSDDVIIEAISNSLPGNSGGLMFYRSRGTPEARTPPLAGDLLALISGRAWDGTTYQGAAEMGFRSDTDYATVKSGHIYFITRHNGTAAERVRISPQGYVGIGTTNPTQLLHVSGSPALFDGATGGIIIGPRSGTNSSFQWYNQTGEYLSLWTNDNGAGSVINHALSIRRNGNVGIGTGNPLHELHVIGKGGDEGVTSIFLQDPTANENFGGRLYFDDRNGLNIVKLSAVDNGADKGFLTIDRINGNIGIGEDSPPDAFSVNGNIGYTGNLYNDLIIRSSGDDVHMDFVTKGARTQTGARIEFNGYSNGTQYGGLLVFSTRENAGSLQPRMHIVENGNVGIGVGSPAYKLHVAGPVAGNAAYVNTSDARLKKNVSVIGYGMETVQNLRPVSFEWVRQDEAWQKGRKLGLVAQEVEPVIPEIVSTEDGDEAVKSIAYGDLAPVLIKALQELKNEHDMLRAEFDSYRNRR